MIQTKGLCLKYPDGTMALNNINIQVESGDIVYIIGPSGSGKTSLLKLFMGAEFPTAGSLEVFGQPIVRGQASKIRQLRRLIGPVFQEFKLIKGRTAMDNVMLGARFLDISSRQLRENAAETLIKVGLRHKLASLVENLSWGECQRVAIARAVVRQPLLIIADEPTGNLDKENALNIMELLASFKDKNTAVIITTHATHLLEGIKEGRLIHVDNGSIHEERLG